MGQHNLLCIISSDDAVCITKSNLTLLSTLCDTGYRVQELIELRVRDLILGTAPVLILTGKGNKRRKVPLMKNTLSLLERYISENNLDKAWKSDYLLFQNKQHRKLTKEGVAYIISQYVSQARKESCIVPEKVTPHMFRHSKAVHLLRAGVSLIYIRDLLGHEHIKTTEVYAKCDPELKRQALENAYPDLVDCNLPDWNKDAELISWLSKL